MPTMYLTPQYIKPDNIYETAAYGTFYDECSGRSLHLKVPIESSIFESRNPLIVAYANYDPSARDPRRQWTVESAYPAVNQDEFARIFSDVKGLGPKTIETIYQTLGDFAFEKIIDNPSILQSLNLRSKLNAVLYQYVMANKYDLCAHALYVSYGFSATEASYILDKLHFSHQEFLTRPYDLLLLHDKYASKKEDAPKGLTFKRIDKIVIDKHISVSKEYRMEHGIKYAFHHKLPNDRDFNGNTKFIDIAAAGYIEQHVLSDIPSKDILKAIRVNQYLHKHSALEYQSKHYYELENDLFESLKLREGILHNDIQPDTQMQTIQKLEDDKTEIKTIEFAPEQIDAIENSVKYKLSCITGGPGTGKTTVLNGLISTLNKNEENYIIMLAPTGRAAKRIGEATGQKASTIHSALYTKNFFHPEIYSNFQMTVIIDECSMVNENLFSSLIDRIPFHARIVFVGDFDQLPPIGPGEVFKNLIENNVLPTVRLKTVQRQKATPSQISLANLIQDVKDGKELLMKNYNTIAVNLYSTDKVEDAIDWDIKTRKTMLYDLNKIQIITPYSTVKQPVSAIRLNNRLQPSFNENAAGDQNLYMEKKSKNPEEAVRFFEGDRVINLENENFCNVLNNATVRIMNGDIGYVTRIDNSKGKQEMYVRYDNAEVIYTYKNIQMLALAYVITVHKSQGSEFTEVIFALPSHIRSDDTYLIKNMIFTAISRPKEHLAVYGRQHILNAMTQNIPEDRNTYFSDLCSGV